MVWFHVVFFGRVGLVCFVDFVCFGRIVLGLIVLDRFGLAFRLFS